jgi:hypothetical protein
MTELVYRGVPYKVGKESTKKGNRTTLRYRFNSYVVNG